MEPFPRAAWYRAFFGCPGRMVRDGPADPETFPCSERHLQCVWYDPAWRPATLVSSAGEDVAVAAPGRWNLEAGPDFLDATLVLGPGRRRITGDVEVHVRPRDWLAHGHDSDPRYGRVVAHVAYFPGALPPGALPAGAVQVSLKDALASNPMFAFEAVDPTAYPYAALAGRPARCAAALAGWPPDERARLMEAAGEERLRRKAARIALAIRERGEDQVLYEEVLCALGYKNNRVPFRRLARIVPVDVLRDGTGRNAVAAYAILLGAAGLLPDPHTHADAETRRFLRLLWDVWWRNQARWEQGGLASGAWRLSGLRPQNHPVRRLAAAASIFTAADRLGARLHAVDRTSPAAWFDAASGLFTGTGAIPYFRRRLTFRGGREPAATALLGKERAAAILANVALPFLAAGGANVNVLAQSLPPEQDNSLIREMAHTLFGRDHNPALHRTGLRQQGLLQIFHDFCLNARAGECACPLAEALGKPPEHAQPRP